MHKRRDMLLSEGVNTAVRFLEKSKEFFPFGIGIDKHGQLTHVQTEAVEELPSSESVLASLAEGLASRVAAGIYCGVAMVSDVKLQDQLSGVRNDAIRVDIEDGEGAAVTCYIPYVLHDDQIQTSDVIAVQGKPFATNRRG